MKEFRYDKPHLFEAFVKSAQYFVRLKTQQDVWAHLGKFITTYFPADWVAFVELDKENAVSIHHCTMLQEAAAPYILKDEVRTLIVDVLDSGFLASRVILTPEPSMTVFLPIVEEYQTKLVMLIGHGTADPLPNELLNIYLAIAGLAGTTCERLHSESELIRHRAHLEELVKERTAELAKAKRRNELILHSVREGICGVDLDGRITFVNPFAAQMLGWDPLELIGRGAHATFHHMHKNGCSYPAEECPVYSTLANGCTNHAADEEFLRKGGTRFPVEFTTAPIIEEGSVVGAVIVFQDITERRRAENALQESERRYATTLASIGDAVIATDEEGRIAFMNTVAEELTGWTFHEAVKKPAKEVFNIINEHTRQRVEDPVTIVLENGATVGLANHTVLIRKDGTEVPIDDSGAPIRARDGSITGVVLVFRDITERKRAELELQGANEELEVIAEELRQQNDELISAQSALRESEENYRTIVETANEGIWVVDSETRTTYVNRRVAEMLGCSPGEIIGKKSTEFMDEEDKARMDALFERRRQGVTESFEVKFLRKDGSPLWTISSAAPLRDGEGKFLGSLGMLTDITERKKAEDEVHTAMQRFYAVLSNMYASILLVADDGRIEFANQAFCDFFGLLDSPADLTGITSTEMIKKIKNAYLNPDEEVARIEEIVELGQPVRGEEIAMRGDRTCLRDFVPIYVDGKSYGRLWHHLEITVLKRVEEAMRESRSRLELKVQERTSELQNAKEELEVTNEELRIELEHHSKLEADLIKAKDAAEASVKAKAAFLANMSHELRTPMNAVIGFSSLLMDDSLTSEQKEYIEGIRKGGEALLAIINDILEFSRAEKDKIELERQLFSLKHLIDESLELVAVQACEKGLNLSETISYGTPDVIIGDQGRLRQILVNLLTNAVKFTDDGDVSMSVSSRADKGNERQIFFEVRDTGIGIPGDKISEIFEPFVQVERTISRKRDGVGLGLAITKNLVELMGGEIRVESAPGRGTTFSFMIPAETASDKRLDFGKVDREVASGSLSGLKPMRILVAEDNPSNQRVLVEMLKRLGYRPDAVADGSEVVQALERQDYDLVLMDVKMPEMDGITATQVIRKLLPENGPRIVAVTAFALEGDREKCLEAGMDDYISKPVKIAELADILRKYQESD